MKCSGFDFFFTSKPEKVHFKCIQAIISKLTPVAQKSIKCYTTIHPINGEVVTITIMMVRPFSIGNTENDFLAFCNTMSNIFRGIQYSLEATHSKSKCLGWEIYSDSMPK